MMVTAMGGESLARDGHLSTHGRAEKVPCRGAGSAQLHRCEAAARIGERSAVVDAGALRKAKNERSFLGVATGDALVIRWTR